MNKNIRVNEYCSHHFTYRMLFHCGETWQRLRVPNLPSQEASWQSYKSLATEILDPMVEMFGPPIITYGFCGDLLRRSIAKRPYPGIAPKLDQHAACELNLHGQPICSRLGAAVDLIYPQFSSLKIATWLAEHTPFDRIYIYGEDRPLHLSHGPEHAQQIIQINTKNNRRIPKLISLEQLKGMS